MAISKQTQADQTESVLVRTPPIIHFMLRLCVSVKLHKKLRHGKRLQEHDEKDEAVRRKEESVKEKRKRKRERLRKGKAEGKDAR